MIILLTHSFISTSLLLMTGVVLADDDHHHASDFDQEKLGNASPNDKTYAKQKQALQLLQRVLKDEPQNPGVVHYIIHSSDYPELAELGLEAARMYTHIAPAVPHSLHMPSHIFIRLGE